MNKTIINGIDASECIHLDEWKHCNICKGLIKTIPDRHQCVTEQDLRCEYYSNCYFKQLKRLQKENKELKEKIDIYENSIIANHDRAVGKRLMEVLQTLEEIRSYCEEQNLKADYTACEVLAIIDKVLNEN